MAFHLLMLSKWPVLLNRSATRRLKLASLRSVLPQPPLQLLLLPATPPMFHCVLRAPVRATVTNPYQCHPLQTLRITGLIQNVALAPRGILSAIACDRTVQHS